MRFRADERPYSVSIMLDDIPPSLKETDSAASHELQHNGIERVSRNFPCDRCGADLTFHIDEQSLECDHCGHVKELQPPDSAVSEHDFREMVQRVIQLRKEYGSEEDGLSEVTCSSCSGTVRFAGTLTSRDCAYCGASLQLDDVHEAGQLIPVDGVLSFLVTRDDARANLRKWVQSRWFAPNAYKKRGVQGRFSGVYLPYWTVDSMTGTTYVGQRGVHYYVSVGSGKNRRRVRRTSWYPASGRFQQFFDDVLVVAGKGLPEKRLEALEPWPLAKCVPFNKELLAGFLARTYDIDLDVGFIRAKERIDEALETEVRHRIGGDVQRIHSINTAYNALTFKHLLLPVWMMGYRFRKKTFQVVVNAGTGEVQGDRPYSWIKIALAVLAGVGAIATIAWLSKH